jgi:hypothetical protein
MRGHCKGQRDHQLQITEGKSRKKFVLERTPKTLYTFSMPPDKRCEALDSPEDGASISEVQGADG